MTGTDMVQRIREQQIVSKVITRTLEALSDFKLCESGRYNGMNLWVYTRPATRGASKAAEVKP